MEIVIIHGQMHKGSTYHITEQLKLKICKKDDIVHEFFLPKDGPDYCVGCVRCIKEGEEKCPHYNKVEKIVTAMERSEIIIVDSPTYCMSMTGQLKILFDHFAFMWLPHRPNASMFQKKGVVISTAAGGGAKKVTKLLKEQLLWLGISNCFQISFSVYASSWNEVSNSIRDRIEKKTDLVAKRIKKDRGSSLKIKGLFFIMRMLQNSGSFTQKDKKHWQENGWLERKRPWKREKQQKKRLFMKA